ncbi:MAG: hypothetical protein PHR22_04540 [Candidatus Omnitrophica bacterium]|nr:hypothetical protein [Candidatus Omnitrophota bacterium]
MSTSYRIKKIFVAAAVLQFIFLPASAAYDTYYEDFSARNPGVTINGQDNWAVTQGGTGNAIVDNTVSPTGSGRSLRISDASPTVMTGRTFDYGGLSPTWVSYTVKAASGNRQRSVPSGGLAAVTFDYTGKILANNGKAWVDTGMTYDTNTWYTVSLKLNYTTHTYDLYISPFNNPNTQFVPVKTGLQFIDPAATAFSYFGFSGSYSSGGQLDSFVSNISVSYIYRLEFINTPQVLVQGEVSGPIIVQLQNANSEPQTALNDYTLELKSTSAGGKFSLFKEPWADVNQVVLSRNSQNVTFYYKDSASGNPMLTVAVYPEIGWLDALQQQRITPRGMHFTVTATTPQIAGRDFNLTITAKDENGNINTDYSGTVVLTADYISPASGTQLLSKQEASGFAQGVMGLQLNYADAGTIAVSVVDKDDSTQAGVSGAILFLPAYISITTQTPQVINRGYDVSVQAKNLAGQLTRNYKGNVRLSPVFVLPAAASGASFSPGVIGGGLFSGGAATVPVSYNRWGTAKVRAEDSQYPSIFVESPNIKFVPAAINIIVPTPPSGRDFYYIGEVIPVEVDINDAFDLPITNFAAQVAITASPNLNLPSSYNFGPADQGKHVFSVSSDAVGTYTVRVRDTDSNISAESARFEVRNATIQVIDTTSPIGTGEILIQLVDDQGRVITTENNLAILIKLIEGLDNVSASSMGTVTPVRFINGQIRIPVSDTEAEEVGIIPQTELGLKIKSGKITFGKISKSGIGTLMWREIKEKKEKK